MTIAKDRVVTLEYSLKDKAGKLIDSSEGGDNLVYLHGNENIIPGLEKHLEGKTAGDKVTCVVPAVEGYGERNEALVMKISRKDFGPGATIEPGMQFEAHGGSGVQIVTVVKVEAEDITIDANHPLAGENLHFDVNVVDVREATEQELQHGHIHGECGCGGGCGDGECGDDCECEDGCGDEGCGCGSGGCGCGD